MHRANVDVMDYILGNKIMKVGTIYLFLGFHPPVVELKILVGSFLGWHEWILLITSEFSFIIILFYLILR